MRAHKFLKGETELSLAWVGDTPQAAAQAGGARTLPAEMSRRDATGSPLESKIDVIDTLPRLGGAETISATGGAGSADADDDGAADATGGSATTAKASTQGLATSFDGLDLGTDDSQDLDAAKDEIARSKIDSDDAVIVSHDDDDGEDSALF